MKKMIDICNKESGQALVDYGLIISLIVLVTIAALQAFGLELGILYKDIISKLQF